MVYRDTAAISTKIILNAQSTDLPDDIVDEIRGMWRAMEFGNDYYYVQFDVLYEKKEQEEEDVIFYTPLLIAYLEEHNVESCLIHWWW